MDQKKRKGPRFLLLFRRQFYISLFTFALSLHFFQTPCHNFIWAFMQFIKSTTARIMQQQRLWVCKTTTMSTKGIAIKVDICSKTWYVIDSNTCHNAGATKAMDKNLVKMHQNSLPPSWLEPSCCVSLSVHVCSGVDVRSLWLSADLSPVGS